MPKVAWTKLMRLGMVELRLSPDRFWGLTPAELLLMSGIDASASTSMSRGRFAEMAARFPDELKG